MMQDKELSQKGPGLSRQVFRTSLETPHGCKAGRRRVLFHLAGNTADDLPYLALPWQPAAASPYFPELSTIRRVLRTDPVGRVQVRADCQREPAAPPLSRWQVAGRQYAVRQ